MSEVAPFEKEPKSTIGFGDVVRVLAIIRGEKVVKFSQPSARAVVVGLNKWPDDNLHVDVFKIRDETDEPVLVPTGLGKGQVLALVTDEVPWTIDQVTEATARFYGVLDQPESMEEFREAYQELADVGQFPYDFHTPKAG